MLRLVMFASVCLALAGCGDSSDPFSAADGGAPPVGQEGADAATGGSSADAAPNPGSADAGQTEPGACPTTPTRLIVLGDSINACSTIGGKNDPRCSTKQLHDFLAAGYAPGISYENVAIGGAVTQTVVDRQLPAIAKGQPGHVLVNVFIGGNDLQPYIFIADSAAQSQYDVDKPRLLGLWDQIFAFFDDPANFPDGVTILMNTQYNPFDDCTAPPYNLSALKISLLNQYNDELRRLAEERSNTYITDQHATYLGHGHHYQVASCPHYAPGLEGWMADLIHPNEPGHAHLASEWENTLAKMYGSCGE